MSLASLASANNNDNSSANLSPQQHQVDKEDEEDVVVVAAAAVQLTVKAPPPSPPRRALRQRQDPTQELDLDHDKLIWDPFVQVYEEEEDAVQQQQQQRELQGNAARLPLVEIMLQVFVLRELEIYVNAARIAPELTGNGPYTFLTPWNAAWRGLSEELRAKLRNPSRAWTAHLQNILRYHITDGDYALSTLQPSQTVTMKNGESVEITLQQGTSRVRVNGVLAIASYDATNGQAYMLDEVLLPAWLSRTLLDLASSVNVVSTLAALVVAAELETALTNPSADYTIFAPNNAAFAALPQQTLDFLQSNQGKATLQDILRYHIATGGPYPSTFFTARTIPTLLPGGELRLTPGNTPTIRGSQNQANLVTLDVPANNGLVHVIDAVLLLEGGGGGPTPTSPTPSPPSTPSPPTPTTTASPTRMPVVPPAPAPRPAEFRLVGRFQSLTPDIRFGAASALAGSVRVALSN